MKIDWAALAICWFCTAVAALVLLAVVYGGIQDARSGTPPPTPCPATLPMPGNPAILLPVCGGE